MDTEWENCTDKKLISKEIISTLHVRMLQHILLTSPNRSICRKQSVGRKRKGVCSRSCGWWTKSTISFILFMRCFTCRPIHNMWPKTNHCLTQMFEQASDLRHLRLDCQVQDVYHYTTPDWTTEHSRTN